MSKELKLTRGCVAIVDDADYEWLNQWKWCAATSGSRGLPYAVRSSRRPLKKSISMARLIMGNPKGMCVDHINGNSLDNRRCNLRICTLRQNAQNVHRWKGLYKGVHEGNVTQKKGRRWIAQIVCDRKHQYLGTFFSPQDAARAYDKAALRLFGEFAHVNFPKKGYEAENIA